jgi:hypothetical protein
LEDSEQSSSINSPKTKHKKDVVISSIEDSMKQKNKDSQSSSTSQEFKETLQVAKSRVSTVTFNVKNVSSKNLSQMGAYLTTQKTT